MIYILLTSCRLNKRRKANNFDKSLVEYLSDQFEKQVKDQVLFYSDLEK